MFTAPNFYMKGYLRMSNEQFSRTALLIGEEALQKLKESHIAVFGVGGVGGYAVEDYSYPRYNRQAEG